MNEKQYNVLVLCTGNSARSILGEVLFNHLGKGKLKAYSAGSKPAGKVNPGALELLQQQGYSTAGLRSKSWDEFAAPGAPEFDFIFTVCDNAAGEACPLWLGHPATAHWGIPDPAHVEGDEERREVLLQLRQVPRRERAAGFRPEAVAAHLLHHLGLGPIVDADR